MVLNQLSIIEDYLYKDELEEALNLVRDIKSSNNELANRDIQMLDYYSGQALWRIHLRDNSTNLDDLKRAINYLKSALAIDETFPDSHMVLGLAYMRKYGLSSFYKDRKKAVFHLGKAKELNNSLSEECNKNLEFILEPEVIICNLNKDSLGDYRKKFSGYPKVKIIIGNILSQECDAVVSPANSFGFMDGGLDYKLSEYFGQDLERRLQKIIREKHNSELLVGEAEIVETGNRKIPYIVSSPTMRVPMQLEKTSINAYLSTRAALLAIDKFNTSTEKKIHTVAFPLMCTGVGKMPYSTSARQMRIAYDDVVLGKFKFPTDIGKAQDKNAVLFSDYY